VSPAKTTELVAVLFGMWTRVFQGIMYYTEIPTGTDIFWGGHTWACQGMLAVDTLNILDVVHEGQQQCGL